VNYTLFTVGRNRPTKEKKMDKKPTIVAVENASLLKLGLRFVVRCPEGWQFALDGATERPCYDKAEASKAAEDEIEQIDQSSPAGEFAALLDAKPAIDLPAIPAVEVTLGPVEILPGTIEEPASEATPIVANIPAPLQATPADSDLGIVVVPDAGATAGALVWWRLTGEIDHGAMCNAWVGAGLKDDDLIWRTSRADALAAAVARQTSKHTFARPLPKGGGWVLVNEATDTNTNDLSWAGNLRVSVNDRALAFSPIGHPAESAIQAAYAHALEAVSASAIGSWLAKQARNLGAIGLRQNGGVYFIPADVLAAWKERIAVIKSVSAHVFQAVPAMKTEDAVAAIIDAMEQEAGREAADLEAEIMAGNLTERALNTRAERTADIATKVARYEKVLGAAMPALAARLEQLEATIAAAVFAVRMPAESK
jgi:hypothetical protein